MSRGLGRRREPGFRGIDIDTGIDIHTEVLDIQSNPAGIQESLPPFSLYQPSLLEI
jgi:hypothetical protein